MVPNCHGIEPPLRQSLPASARKNKVFKITTNLSSCMSASVDGMQKKKVSEKVSQS